MPSTLSLSALLSVDKDFGLSAIVLLWTIIVFDLLLHLTLFVTVTLLGTPSAVPRVVDTLGLLLCG